MLHVLTSAHGTIATNRRALNFWSLSGALRTWMGEWPSLGPARMPSRGPVTHRVQRPPRGVCHRHIDHAAVDHGRGVPLRDSPVEGLDHARIVGKLRLTRTIEPVAGLDLRGMDELAPAIAEPPGERGVAL